MEKNFPYLSFIYSLAAIFFFALCSKPLCAQSDTTGLCFRGQPLAYCKAFWITEVGAYAGTGTSYASCELGGMINSSDHSAYGATAVASYDGTIFRMGLKGRYRYWLNRSMSVDFGFGYLTYAPTFAPPKNAKGPIADVALNLRDQVAFVCRVDRAALFGGVRLGSKPAVYATATATLVGVVFSAFLPRLIPAIESSS